MRSFQDTVSLNGDIYQRSGQFDTESGAEITSKEEKKARDRAKGVAGSDVVSRCYFYSGSSPLGFSSEHRTHLPVPPRAIIALDGEDSTPLHPPFFLLSLQCLFHQTKKDVYARVQFYFFRQFLFTSG